MGIFGPSFEAYRRIEDRFQTRRLLHAFGVWLRVCQMAQLKLHLMCKPKMLARTIRYAHPYKNFKLPNRPAELRVELDS